VRGRILAAGTAAALLAGAGTAWAAFTQEGAPYGVGNAPYNVFAADFNGDGRPDFAAGNGDAGTVSLYLRQAGGGFAEEAGSPFTAASSNGAVADFNGDGRPDIAIAGFIREGVGVLLRNAGGGFTREAAPLAGARLSAIGAGDFNRDGKADMAVGLWDSASVQILLRNASNDGFTVGDVPAVGAAPRQIAVADYNGDGFLDLAVLNNASQNVRVLLGNGNGNFAAEGADISVGANPQTIVAADFDLNGRPDLAVTNAGSNTVSVLLRNAANNGFAEDTGSPVATSVGPGGMAVADFDRNGVPDLAVAASSGGLDVLQRGGSGFARTQTTAVTGAPSGVAVADFNGDGVQDAVVSSLGTNQVTALLNPSPAQPPPSPTPTPQPVRNKSVAAEPESGTVLIKVKGKFVPLKAGVIANGSEIDVRKGRVGITTSTNEQADFYDGIFKISQSGGITTVTLSEKLTGCPRSTSKATAAAKKSKTRKLWGDGKGKFRTKGSYSAATVRGTRWFVQDRCTTTFTRVKTGVVEVRDEVKKKTVVLRKGKSYTARKKR
jgi:hypothetical protein